MYTVPLHFHSLLYVPFPILLPSLNRVTNKHLSQIRSRCAITFFSRFSVSSIALAHTHTKTQVSSPTLALLHLLLHLRYDSFSFLSLFFIFQLHLHLFCSLQLFCNVFTTRFPFMGYYVVKFAFERRKQALFFIFIFENRISLQIITQLQIH